VTQQVTDMMKDQGIRLAAIQAAQEQATRDAAMGTKYHEHVEGIIF
jgi:hypothetical protein